MALDVSKLRQQEQVQATGNNPAASTSASTSSQPIDMKTGTMTPEEKQAKILEFIKSSEFKKCPDDQKLELLKQQFPDLAGLPEKDIARYIAEAINTLPAEEKAEIAETIIRADNKHHTKAMASAVNENLTKDTLVEIKQPAETTEKTAKNNNDSQDLETLALQYAEKNKLGTNIDEIISHIKSKQVENTQLTEEEEQILNLFNAQQSQTTETTTSSDEIDANFKNLVEQYAKDNNLTNDIDATVEKIKRASLDRKLTEIEQQILNQYEELKTNKESEVGTHQEIKSQIDDNSKAAISAEAFDNAIKEKDFENKIDIVLRDYLETHDPEYSKIEDNDEKQAYLISKRDVLYTYVSNSKYNQLVEKCKIDNNFTNENDCDTEYLINVLKNKDPKTLTNEEKQLLKISSKGPRNEESIMFNNVLTALQVLHEQDKSIEELPNIPKDSFDKDAIKTMNKNIQASYSKIKEEESDPTRRLYRLFDLQLRLEDPEYANLTQAEQLDRQQAKLETIINSRLEVENKTMESLETEDYVDLVNSYAAIVDKTISNLDMESSFATQIKGTKRSDWTQARIELLNSGEIKGLSKKEIQEEIERLSARQIVEFTIEENLGKTNNELIEALKISLETNPDNQYLKDQIEILEKEINIGDTNSEKVTENLFDTIGFNKDSIGNKRKNFRKYFEDVQNNTPERLEESYIRALSRAQNIRNPKRRDKELDKIRDAYREITGCSIEDLAKIEADSSKYQYRNFARAAIEGGKPYGKKVQEALLTNSQAPWKNKVVVAMGDETVMGTPENAADAIATSDIFNGEHPEYEEPLGYELNKNIEFAKKVVIASEKNKDTSKGEQSNLTRTVVETAPSDDARIDYNKTFSQTGNAATLEGLAAAGNSVQNPEYRKQYNSIVTEAAKNYPPEVQNTIQTALTTGEISEQTRNSTAPASNSYYPEADTYTPQSTYNNTDSNTYNSNTYNSNYSSQTTTQTYSNQGATSNPSYNTTEVYTSNVYPQNTYSNSFVTPDIETSIRGYNSTTRSVETSNYTVSSTSTSKIDPQQVRENAAAKQAEANQQMKDIALENAAEVKQQIEESIAEWELKQELKLSDEVISELKEIAASEALEEFIQTNPTKKEQIIQKLSSATSLSEVYDILLSNLGSKVHQKFIDNLATAGSTSEVRAFLKSKAGNTAVIKEILLRTSNQTLRSELINMLPASDVIELLENNLISTLNSIDHKIIYEYLAKNIYSMTQTNFANYLKYLPFDEREKLIAMRNQAYGIKSEQDKKADVKVETTTQGIQQNQQTVAQNQPTQPKVATNPQTPQHSSTQQKPEQPVENPQTKFKAGETTKVLNDGRVITRQGTTFAGISDNAEEGFRVVDPKTNKKAKEGAPIGMNDEVLIPGSQEWLMKYNKQAPKTAFTMAALEDQAEDTGLNLGSNHAKIGQPIKKKYNPNGFNLRG